MDTFLRVVGWGEKFNCIMTNEVLSRGKELLVIGEKVFFILLLLFPENEITFRLIC